MKIFVVAVFTVCLGVTLAQQRQGKRQQNSSNNNQQNNNDQQYNDPQQYNNDQQQYSNNNDQQQYNNNQPQQQQYNQNNNQQFNSQRQQPDNRQSSSSSNNNNNDKYTTTPYPPIPIIRFQKEQTADGSYKTSYETGNNIIAEETGFLKNIGDTDKEALVQHGSYSYNAPDGTLITVTYTADEQGFRATGDHLPTPPPIPAEIQKSLDQIYEAIRIQAEESARNPNVKHPDEEDGSYNFNYQDEGSFNDNNQRNSRQN